MYIISGRGRKSGVARATEATASLAPLSIPLPSIIYLFFAVNITPTVELNALAMKRGEPAVYTFLDTVRPHGQQPLASGSIFRGMYNQR